MATRPRRYLPDMTHSFTRRAAQRLFRLTPSEDVNQVILYSLGRALQKRKTLSLLSFTAMSNHVHSVGHDGHKPGEVSEFPDLWRDFFSLTGRGLNVLQGQGENLWRDGGYRKVGIHDNPALVDQLLYAWTNPVLDGLVAHPEDWPGVIFLPKDFGTTITVEKPVGGLFGGRRKKRVEPSAADELQARLAQDEADVRDRVEDLRRAQAGKPPVKRRKRRKRNRKRNRSTLPDEVQIKIGVPAGYGDWPIEEVRAHFTQLLEARVREIHLLRRLMGKRAFLGVAAVLAVDPQTAPGGVVPTREPIPRVACKDPDKRVEALYLLSVYYETYALRRSKWPADMESPFPEGSYEKARFDGVPLAAIPDPRATSPPIAA